LNRNASQESDGAHIAELSAREWLRIEHEYIRLNRQIIATSPSCAGPRGELPSESWMTNRLNVPFTGWSDR
jgi:hypothetical protein